MARAQKPVRIGVTRRLHKHMIEMQAFWPAKVNILYFIWFEHHELAKHLQG